MASQRKSSLVPILLLCVLLTLVVVKVFALFQTVPLPTPQTQATVAAPVNPADVDPNRIRVTAQLAQGGSTPTLAVGSTPVYSTCADIPPEVPEDEVFPRCNVPDIADYVTPSCGGAGQSCGVVNSSSVTLTNSYIGNVTNEVIDLGNGYIKQKSNDIFFIYRRNADGSVSLLQDTIWGGGPAGGFFTCDGTSDEAFYRVYNGDTGAWGNQQYPASASCNAPFSNNSKLGTFKKVGSNYNINDPATPDSELLVPDSALEACTVSGQTGITVSNSSRLIFQGAAVCNGVPFDMIAMQNVSGAGAGEVNMYCKGKGLCAFYQTMDFSVDANKPANWVGKDLCNLKAGGSRTDITPYFEYNLQRECGLTPTKVLNNFLDEYSVSCVPKADYILEITDNKDNCVISDRGCANWNVAGDLHFTPGGSLFGLFRNQSAVEARYNTMNGLHDKNRLESIEAFLTGKNEDIPLANQTANTQITAFNQPSVDNLLSFQSPLYKLSTGEQQCELIFDKLTAVKELCEPFNRIEGEEAKECAINQFLPNTSLRYTDMLSKMTAPGGGSLCRQLMNPTARNAEAVAIRDQILSIDPAMEVAYRPAFIVLATRVGDPAEDNPQFLGQGTDDSHYYQVDYLEVKVPTFGSDFLHKTANGSASNPTRAGSTYRDPLRFLGDLFTTPEVQEKYRQEEENDRNAIRAKSASLGVDYPMSGEVIGLGPVPIKCRTAKGSYDTAACDNIAKALINFINSSTVVPVSPGEADNGDSLTRQFSPQRGWLPASKCEVLEKELYGNSVMTENPVPEEYRVAEQANSIGSKLEPKDGGKYIKKTDGYAEVETNVPDLSSQDIKGGDFGRTQIFFVSPHNYTMLYAQNAMLSLLTKEQQETLLKNETFNSTMKTTGLDSFTSSKAVGYYTESVTTPPLPDATPVPNRKEISVEMDRKQENGKTLDSPLMWQVAGSIANYPTRLFTLITTTVDNKMRQFTLGCGRTADGKPNPNATENWLLGNCVPAPETITPNPDDVPPANNASNKCIQIYVDETAAANAAADLLANLPGQQIQSPQFAGWSRYFGVEDRPEDQHLFNNSCGGQRCIEYILQNIQGTGLNPYLVMAIALNETGGLISAKPGFVGPHFGCGVGGSGEGGQVISDGTIESKLQCLKGFFANQKSNFGQLSDSEVLSKYGYSNGNRNQNLTKIMGIISGGKAPALCNPTPQTGGNTPTAN